MNYTVLWTGPAEQQLAAVWIDARDRASVTGAAETLDEGLRKAPEALGESRPDGRRIAFSAPLGILFRVWPADRKVVVLTAWDISRRRGR